MSYVRIHFLMLEVVVVSLVVLIPFAGLRSMIWPSWIFLLGALALLISSIVCFRRHRRLAISGFVVLAFTIWGMIAFPSMVRHW